MTLAAKAMIANLTEDLSLLRFRIVFFNEIRNASTKTELSKLKILKIKFLGVVSNDIIPKGSFSIMIRNVHIATEYNGILILCSLSGTSLIK